MQQELDQIIPTISDNPFMKNDKKKTQGNVFEKKISKQINKQGSKIDNLVTEQIADEVEASKKDDLKRELSSVLKSIRKDEETVSQVSKSTSMT